MDVHHRSGIQIKATHLIQKVSRLRPKFKLNHHRLGDDSDLHRSTQYQYHQRAKSAANGVVVTSDGGPDDETTERSSYNSYMSQPLLKAAGPGTEDADPRASPSYDVPSSRQSKHTRPPAAPALFPLSANITSPSAHNDFWTRTIKNSTDQDATIKIERLASGNSMYTAAATSIKEGLDDDDDVPLMILKQHGPKRSGRSMSAVDFGETQKATSPDIVISSLGHNKTNDSDRTREPASSSFSSSHDPIIIPQPRKAPITLHPPPPPAPCSAAQVPSIRIMTDDAPSPEPHSVHLPYPAGTSSFSSTRSNRIPVSPLSTSPRLSRRISVYKDGNLSTLRFSPSIVTRHPALPLKLPPLPPVSPATESSVIKDANTRKRDSRIGLRSMPALPHSGPGDGAGAHEEEDGDEDDMDDIDEETEERGHPHPNTNHTMSSSGDGSEPSARRHPESPSFTTAWGGVSQESNFGNILPQVDTTPLDRSFVDESPTPISNYKGKGKAREEDVATPTDRLQRDDFPKISGAVGASSKGSVPNKGVSITQPKRMSLVQQRTSGLAPYSPQSGVVTLKTLPLPRFAEAERPGMYKRGSQSMVDIHLLLKPVVDALPSHDNSKKDGPDGEVSHKLLLKTTLGAETPPSPTILRRRRSLPSYYGPSAPPPPYPTFPHRPLIQPREDEGREKLPPYSNDIYLKSIMPRKMEFSRPGYQARDRKWRRVICILEGTMLRVYRCPPRAAGLSIIEGWWEKKTGVGDASSSTTSYVTATSIIRGPPMRDAQERRSVSPVRNQNKHEQQAMRSNATVTIRPDIPPLEPKRSRLVPFFKGRNHGRSNSDAPHPMVNPSQRSPRGSLNLPRTPMSGSTVSSRAPSPGPTSQSSILGGGSVRSSNVTTPEPSLTQVPRCEEEVPEPELSDLIKIYTLQNAECGLGLDYIKRRNVIRVKMEGEQFLLQAKDAQEVVGWIEGMQSGTNVALDLDERAMPRGPLFPRRRRRRRE